jgi:hypothetical protein
MPDLFVEWRRRVDTFSHRAMAAYTEELPDYRRILADPKTRAEMVDFGVFVRARTVDIVAEDSAFTGSDLDTLVEAGRERGAAGISPASHQHALVLHASLTLREVHEAARPQDVEDLMHTLRTLPSVGVAAQAAYTRGFLQGQRNRLPLVDRVQVLVDLLLAGDPMAAALATDLAMGVPARWVVLVARTPRETPAELLARHWVPLSWRHGELIALVGADGTRSARERALSLAQDLGQVAVGAAEGSDLAATLEQARQVCAVAPPGRMYYPNDLFAELAVAQVPAVDGWLRDVARQLADGPQLVPTLDSFYRNSLGRTLAAAELNIHPRTLDYRLRRVRELTGLEPASVRGVRILSTAVARVLSGAWD